MIRVGVDIGGTFTDGVLVNTDDGSVRHSKSPSTPGEPIKGLLDVMTKLDIDPANADLFVHGTTLVTNLILQRTGCRVGLLTTEGFRDVLEIQRSYRPDPLNILWVKPEPLIPRNMRLEISERTLADGTILVHPERDQVLEMAKTLEAQGAEAIAICFMNSFVNPQSETLVCRWIEEALPQIPVSISSEVDRQIREYERTSTTAINAYAIPEVRTYLTRLTDALQRDVLLMHSGGGVLPAAAVANRPVKLVQSGPAGGVIAAQALGARVGRPNLITFDMGGTSTDVSVISDGEVVRAEETEITWGIPLRAESLEIRSVGAGGGSIAFQDEGGVLRVGPRSAGAHPGPAAYGLGGTDPTVTDANLVLGIIDASRFLGGEMVIDAAAALTAITGLANQFNVSADDAALGVHSMVNANMAQLIREMTANKGQDPREFSLVSFGGAGGQHAYGVASLVGCSEVLFPRHAGAFSALGLVQADLQTSEAQSIIRSLTGLSLTSLDEPFDELEHRARQTFGRVEPADTTVVRRVMMRYDGQTHEVLVDILASDESQDLYARFEDIHEGLYGTRLGDPAEIVSIHITVSLNSRRAGVSRGGDSERSAEPQPISSRWSALFQDSIPVYDGYAFGHDSEVRGPALVEEGDTVIVIPPLSLLTFDAAEGLYSLSLETN